MLFRDAGGLKYIYCLGSVIHDYGTPFLYYASTFVGNFMQLLVYWVGLTGILGRKRETERGQEEADTWVGEEPCGQGNATSRRRPDRICSKQTLPSSLLRLD